MIEEYLNKIDRKSILNLESAKKSIEGENIKRIIEINEDETIYLCESGSSFIFTNQGVTEILTKDETNNRLRIFMEENAKIYNTLNSIMSIKTEKKPEREIEKVPKAPIMLYNEDNNASKPKEPVKS